jgi:phenylpyruvate tautomerase PptA (4-oxalocrotonate tautomerase family)
MPTYICALPADAFGDARKAAIAEAITRIHSEETGAPTFFVQVVIEEKKPTDRFLGGTRMSDIILGAIFAPGARRRSERRSCCALRRK